MYKKALKYVLPLILAFSILSLVLSGCGNSPDTSTPSPSPTENEQAAKLLAQNFIENSSTFKFDGIEGSVKFIEMKPSPISAYRSGIFVFDFQTAHPGHGDRTGLVLAQVITNHQAEITVNLENITIVSASCDNTWDMLDDKDLPVTIHGVVISGGDTTQPGGPLDAPRKFVYLVLTDEGYFINVSYTAYPPSPAGDAAREKITLDFYNGQIEVGQEITARGTLDKASNTVIVAEQGDFITTAVRKTAVLGAVVSIEKDADKTGQTIYELLRDEGTFINISLSPDAAAAQSLYNQAVRVGDYMKAVGNYDRSTNTVRVDGPDDMIKTYEHRVKLGE